MSDFDKIEGHIELLDDAAADGYSLRMSIKKDLTLLLDVARAADTYENSGDFRDYQSFASALTALRRHCDG